VGVVVVVVVIVVVDLVLVVVVTELSTWNVQNDELSILGDMGLQ
jgi:hypothetical protein